MVAAVITNDDDDDDDEYDSDDEDVDEGEDEECFSFFIRRIADTFNYCNPAHGFSRNRPALRQGRRAVSRGVSSLSFSIQRHSRIAGSNSPACTKYWRIMTPHSGGNRLRRACIGGDIKSSIAATFR